MKKTNIFLAILICLPLLFTGHPNQESSNICLDGGIVIFTEGLTEEPIRMVFSSSLSQGPLFVEILIINTNANLIYTDVQSSRHVRICQFEVPTGQYLLEVKVNGEVRKASFFI